MPAPDQIKPQTQSTKDVPAPVGVKADAGSSAERKQPDAPLPPRPADTPTIEAEDIHEDDNDTDETALRWSTDVDGIREAMRALMPKVKECYESWLKAAGDDDDISGRVVLRMTIDAEAGEAAARMRNTTIVHNELDHEFMTGCIVNLTEGLRFEIPDEPLELKSPFVFKADPEE